MAYDAANQKGRHAALVTLVHVDGSSYRRPGARMLVTDDGQLTGAISGGCLEGDALRKALHVMSRQQPMLVTYDSMDEEDAGIGIGLGCNGIIQVLIEPIDPNNATNPISLLRSVSTERQPAVLVTLFSLQNRTAAQAGTSLLYRQDFLDSALTGNEFYHPTMLADVHSAMDEKLSSFKHYVAGEEHITAFIEYVQPPIWLVVLGAGNDTIPLAEMARMLGWQVTVVDGRPAYAKADRFIAGCQVLVAKPAALLERLTIDERTAFVLLTHNYNYDLAMLKVLAQEKPGYIGSLGPKKKTDRMLEELRAEQVFFLPSQLNTLYGPAGLDIGAETPQEIALAIIAEIQAVFSGRTAQSLREKNQSIHARSATAIEKVSIGNNG